MIHQFRERAARVNRERAALDERIVACLTARGEAYVVEVLRDLDVEDLKLGSVKSRLETLARHGRLSSRYVPAAELDRVQGQRSGLGRTYFRLAEGA